MRYRDPQLDFDMTAYVQVNAAAKKAWHRLLSSKEQAGELSSIRQGPDKLFQDFVSRLTQTSNRLIGDTEAGQSIVKELAFENPNAVRKAALNLLESKVSLSTNGSRIGHNQPTNGTSMWV